jgi:hypothetical protein
MNVFILSLLLAYVICATLMVITTEFSDQQKVTNEDGTQSSFRHPVFQTMTGFMGELFIACIWAACFMIRNGRPFTLSKTSVIIMALPGVCDLVEALAYNIGMT